MIIPEADFLRHITYLSLPEQAAVEKTLRAAVRLHEGQLRDSGLPYVTHPIAVADYLAHLEADAVTLCAALLHDVIEDDRCTHEEFLQEFGEEITTLVDAVTKLSKLQYEGRRGERQIASLRKLLLVASEDLRVILLKLADRWHNIETIDGLSPEKKSRVASETLDIYVPFARLVGLYDLKIRFEQICFPLAFPIEHELWHREVTQMRASLDAKRQAFIKRIDSETAAHVTPHLTRISEYELFKKLQGNVRRLKDTQNIDSVVLVVDHDDPLSCYDVLGKVHMLYPFRMLSFKDLINMPQPNGYRALHTTIFLSKDHQLLLRIQTRSMYEFVHRRKISSWIRKDTRLTSVLASLSRLPSHHEQFLDDLKSDLLADRINIFTTSGEIFSLPQRATGIDFAFALSPDHIPYLAGIRINGEMREATAELREGDTVELILLDTANPALRAHWMEKVRTVDAKEAIKENLSMNPLQQQEMEGRSILQAECRKRALPSWWIFYLTSLQNQLSMALGQSSFSDVLIAIGTGRLSASKVMDIYKEILVLSPTLSQRVLKFLHLLPRTRVLSTQATIISFEISALDRKGLIYDITKCISERDLNISQFGVYAVPPSDSLYKITVEVQKFEEFSDLFDALLQIPSVKTVLRKL